MKQIFFGIFFLLIESLSIFSSAKDNQKNQNKADEKRKVSFSSDTKVYDGKFFSGSHFPFIFPGRVAVDLSDTDSEEDLSLFAFSLDLKKDSHRSTQKIEVIEPKISLSPDLLTRWNDERRQKNNLAKRVQSLSDIVHEKDSEH
jgi:hypothetical protein